MQVPANMRAMVLTAPGQPLALCTLPVPAPGHLQVLVKVIACGVCRTDLHIADGELPQPALPLVPGHEIVGEVVLAGAGVAHLRAGDQVGIPWLGYTCGQCRYCLAGKENLCDKSLFTGYTIDGGFAEYTVAWAAFCFRLPALYANAAGAPLLCAGLIGYRCYLKIDNNAQHIGLYGFGAAAHLLTQLAAWQQKDVYAFTNPGDSAIQDFACALGAVWAGDSTQPPPVRLDAAILFAPAGELVPQALAQLDKGGQLICGGIHMSDIPGFAYRLLWEERSIASVANLTRQDAEAYFTLAPKVPIVAAVKRFALHQANEALAALRSGALKGAAVLDLSLPVTDDHQPFT
ncbi:zinc-dependent alcohol dehydrogenase family protein [Paraflavitalea pollutisoli]|uniref:zinc-dependent alcohol dehydrogenase family protein n=1 Tax=Paraflavitalea pollutisoli TaxID=3034143 RepID=UPI0023EBF28D|nr:zinc-dependent alcohol dehydrogenase family protein [Paraflavitalea sp. H1-2-19X]